MSNLLKKAEQEILFYLNSVLNGRQAKTILFYPEYPQHRTIIYKILKHLRYNITSNPNHKSDLAFYWEDTTFRKTQFVFKKFNPEKMININCTDISKEKISEVFEEIFSYGFNVDPETYSGECVMKNNLNAKHDGVIMKCPVQNPEKGFVYQKILNNKINDDLVMDIRTPVLKGVIPFIYLKFKKIKDRFTNDLYKSEVASVNEYLTQEEIKKISEFCLRTGLDYGELDVLRSKDDGKIYIVDVNYTPWGPPAKLSEDESRMAVIRISEAFRKIYFG
jgi:hypothetical protein